MSELINNKDSRATIRWKLLTSVSALALMTTISSANVAKAEDVSHPLIWITAGGDMMRLTAQGQPFMPPLVAENAGSPAFQPTPPSHTEAFQPFSYDASLGITFQPENSDWQIGASIQFGRTTRRRSTSELAKPDIFEVAGITHYYTGCITTYSCAGIKHKLHIHNYTAKLVDFSTIQSRESEAHTILDFEAGKDVGIGILPKDNAAHINLGVRVAQFTSRSSTEIHARPDLQYYQASPLPAFLKNWFPNTYVPWHFRHFHTFEGHGSAMRNFQGVGPKLSWNDSLPILGNKDSNVTIDWGANMAVLFGKRKVTAESQISGVYHTHVYRPKSEYVHSTPIHRRKSVIVPNVGGFAGISFNYQDAKVSLGYRGDFYFNAMDTGWDQSRVRTIGMFGPYASISVGIGD